jgi:hypothetical protein
VDKDIADKLLSEINKKMQDPNFLIDEGLIVPKNKIDYIKKRMCGKIVERYLELGSPSLADFAKKCEVGKSSMNCIINYHIQKVSLDTIFCVMEKLSPESSLIRDTILRIAIS